MRCSDIQEVLCEYVSDIGMLKLKKNSEGKAEAPFCPHSQCLKARDTQIVTEQHT